MTTPVKSAAPKTCPPAPSKFSKEKAIIPHRVQALLDEIDVVSAAAFHIIHLMSDTLKERAAHDDLTAGAILWLTRLSWAIDDCREYKVRQLIVNCDETVMDSIPNFLRLLHVLTADAESIMGRLCQQYTISRSLVVVACSLGISIKDVLNTV
jgi:hypothetical protein